MTTRTVERAAVAPERSCVTDLTGALKREMSSLVCLRPGIGTTLNTVGPTLAAALLTLICTLSARKLGPARQLALASDPPVRHVTLEGDSAKLR